MNINRLCSLFVFLSLLAGCTAPTPLPETSTPVSQIPTDTSVPTETSIPSTATSTETATATAMVTPLVTTGGPYLVYLKIAGEQKTIVFADEHGQVINKFLLSPDVSKQMYGLNGLSPDGKWLVYYTGSPDTFEYPYDFPSQGPYDLSLNLLNLDTKENRLITPLLSADFPNNFQQQADDFASNGVPAELQNPNGGIAIELYRSFLGGIHAKAWSPDGRYLAFAGQMNGLSSDLYVYDMETQTIRQLSSGPEELWWISWSPDGKGILHGSTYVVGMGMSCRIYIADLNGTSARYLSETTGCFSPDEWLNDHVYIEYDNENGWGDYHLRSIDIFTGGIVNYWDGSFYYHAIDSQKGLILIDPNTDTVQIDLLLKSTFRTGLYLIDAASGRKTRLLDGIWRTQYFGLGDRRFVILAAGMNEKNYFLYQDGTLTPVEGNYDIISLAPNKEHWIGIGNNKISIFAADNALMREVEFVTPKVLLETWSPNSSGFFFSYPVTSMQTSLYYLNLLSGDPILVESDWSSVYRWFTP